MIDLSIIPSQYFDYLLKEKQAKANLAYYNENGEWMSVEDIEAIALTDAEIETYAKIYFSKRWGSNEDIQPDMKGEVMSMTFELYGDSNKVVGFDYSMFNSLMLDGVDLLENVESFTITNSKDNFSSLSSINYISEEVASLTLKTSRPITENDYYGLVYYYQEDNEVWVNFVKCTQENMMDNFEQIDDTTYKFLFACYITETIEYQGKCAVFFVEDINNIYSDLEDEFGYFNSEDLELLLNNQDGIIDTTMECLPSIELPSSEGVYVIDSVLKPNITTIGNSAFQYCYT